MSDTRSQHSLRNHTSAIRHLDAPRAAQIVKLFARPAVVTHGGLAYDSDDPIADATKGWMSLEPTTAHETPCTASVGCYQTHLYLHELLRLPLSVAKELVQHRGHLYLDKLVRITDSVAAVLADHRGGGLSLNNVRSLSVNAAKALGRHSGELSLNRLNRLSFEQALGLALHTNELHLGGLKELSSKAAAALSRHQGDLTIDGLGRLSGVAVFHLAKHKGKLHLHGIRGLSDAVAEAFGHRKGLLCLSQLKKLTTLQAQLLSCHRGALLLASLEIDDESAAWLGQHEGSLALRVRNTISLSRLESLVQHTGQLQLDGLTDIDERQARVFAAQPCWHGIKGLSGLFLNGIKHLTPSVAAILATHRAGGLSLGGVTLLTEDVARELVRHPILALDGVSSITDEVASILATPSEATLTLKGLQSLSGSALAMLRNNPNIELPARFYRDAERPAGKPVPPGPITPTPHDTIRAIQLIAQRGEEAGKA